MSRLFIGLFILYHSLAPQTPYQNLNNEGWTEVLQWSIHEDDVLIDLLNDVFAADSQVLPMINQIRNIQFRITSHDFFDMESDPIRSAFVLQSSVILINQNIWNQLYLKERMAFIVYTLLSSKFIDQDEGMLKVERVFGIHIQKVLDEIFHHPRNIEQIQNEKEMVIALGGNAFIDGKDRSQEAQKITIAKMMKQISLLVRLGVHPIFVHGNGPQIGDILNTHKDNPDMTMPQAGFQTQRELGQMVQEALLVELKKSGTAVPIKTIQTSVLVSDKGKPTKPVGPWLTEEEALQMKKSNPEMIFMDRSQDASKEKKDSGHTFRRVVYSPKPKDIIQLDQILKAYQEGIVIAAGGGGVPAIQTDEDPFYQLIDGVIDKDLSAAILGNEARVNRLVIVTGASKVSINYNQENQIDFDLLTNETIEENVENGQFPAGSMKEKALATALFVIEKDANEALIVGRDSILKSIFDIGEGAGTKVVSVDRWMDDYERFITDYSYYQKLMETGSLTQVYPYLLLAHQRKEILHSKQARLLNVFLKRFSNASMNNKKIQLKLLIEDLQSWIQAEIDRKHQTTYNSRQHQRERLLIAIRMFDYGNIGTRNIGALMQTLPVSDILRNLMTTHRTMFDEGRKLQKEYLSFASGEDGFRNWYPKILTTESSQLSNQEILDYFQRYLVRFRQWQIKMHAFIQKCQNNGISFDLQLLNKYDQVIKELDQIFNLLFGYLADRAGILSGGEQEFIDYLEHIQNVSLENHTKKEQTPIINYSIHFDRSEFASVKNQFALQIIIERIISNSFHLNIPHIYMSFRKSDDRLIIFIDDDGLGIDEDLLDYVDQGERQKIFLLDETKRSGGTGVGMALAWHLAKLMEGEIKATNLSRHGGARFIIEIPMEAQNRRTSNTRKFLSQYTKNSFIHTLNIDPEKITVIPLAHDTQNYNTVPAILNRDSQKSLKIDWNIPYLLYVGGSNENKNLKRLFLSLHEVIYRHQLQINLVLVGREHFYKKDNIQLIKKLNIESNIQMTGYLPDNIIKYLYQQAEAFIFPSIKEGFGIPLLEAMACGCPVICSNTTSLLEIGQDAVEYINPMETDSMVTTILKIYQNKSLKDELSAKGILHSSQYGWDITCRLIDQTLTNIFK